MFLTMQRDTADGP